MHKTDFYRTRMIARQSASKGCQPTTSNLLYAHSTTIISIMCCIIYDYSCKFFFLLLKLVHTGYHESRQDQATLFRLGLRTYHIASWCVPANSFFKTNSLNSNTTNKKQGKQDLKRIEKFHNFLDGTYITCITTTLYNLTFWLLLNS